MKRGKAREILAPGDSIHFVACRVYVTANLRGFAFDDHVSDESSQIGKNCVNDYTWTREESSEFLVSLIRVEITSCIYSISWNCS